MAKRPSSDFLNFFAMHPTPSWICEKKTLRFTDVNKAASALLGLSKKQWRSTSLNDVLVNGPIQLSSKTITPEVTLKSHPNKVIHAQLLCKSYPWSGKPHWLMIVQGYSEGQKVTTMAEPENLLHAYTPADIEERLRQSVKEKEILIKEIHHRVKNNLQIISSIIYLKMISLELSDIRSFLDSLRQKIKSIALIHERLLQSEKLDEVEIADYLGKLLADIQLSNYRPDLGLEIEHQICEGLLPLDTAIYCGLIVNELLTNSIKHAFHNRPNGKISVTLSKEEKKHLLLVQDNGITLPEYIVPGKANSFGMQMIDVFVKQLNGSWRIIRDNGTTFLIRF